MDEEKKGSCELRPNARRILHEHHERLTRHDERRLGQLRERIRPQQEHSLSADIRDIAPMMLYSYSGPYEKLARHILAAQDSGLAGTHPDYGLSHPAPLNRLIDAAQQDANYRRACPSSYPRPAGLSCDEYPFQSSQQGASTGGGPGRTFEGCQVPLPAGTGPSGYSACMIDETDNSDGGNALGSFYLDQRMLNGDAFYVWITP